MIYNTWCPIFPGFYNTNFSSDYEEEREIEYINEERIENGLEGEIDWDDCEFDCREYENRVVKSFCENLQGHLNSKYVTLLEVEQVVSPKEYNFENDSINIKVELSEDNIKNIQDAIKSNLDAFSQYLKEKYTSRSGFISFHSNHVEDWKADTNDFTDFSKDEHILGSILEFICEVEEIVEFEIFQNMSDNGDLSINPTNYEDLTTKSLNEIRGIEEIDEDGNVIDSENERLMNNRNSEGQMELPI